MRSSSFVLKNSKQFEGRISFIEIPDSNLTERNLFPIDQNLIELNSKAIYPKKQQKSLSLSFSCDWINAGQKHAILSVFSLMNIFSME